MRYPVNNYLQDWYDAQGFGVKTDYGFHDGCDLNLKTGGNTDLGQPLYAIANGLVTSVHEHSTGFGKHIHIQHDGEWGTVYCHYAHCDSILVKVGDVVQEGQQVATLGNTGNSKTAHLHWAIKLMPTGIDGVAKTLDDLKKWTNPIEFVEKWKTRNGQITIDTKVFEELVTKASRFDKFKAEGWDDPEIIKKIISDLKTDLEKERNTNAQTAEQFRAQYKDFVRNISELLGTIQQEPEILDEIRKALESEEELRKLKPVYDKDRKEWLEAKIKLEDEIARLNALVTTTGALDQLTTKELLNELLKRLKGMFEILDKLRR